MPLLSVFAARANDYTHKCSIESWNPSLTCSEDSKADKERAGPFLDVHDVDRCRDPTEDPSGCGVRFVGSSIEQRVHRPMKQIDPRHARFISPTLDRCDVARTYPNTHPWTNRSSWQTLALTPGNYAITSVPAPLDINCDVGKL